MSVDRHQAVLELARQWLSRARNDMALAELVGHPQIAPEIICFHAQQAAEKGLKSLLVYCQVEFLPIHAIAPLLELCRAAGYPPPDELLPAVQLTRFAVTTRYPGDEEPIGPEEMAQAVDLARRVLSWVEAQLPSEVRL
jgi:HEPN domain-containing protein